MTTQHTPSTEITRRTFVGGTVALGFSQLASLCVAADRKPWKALINREAYVQYTEYRENQTGQLKTDLSWLKKQNWYQYRRSPRHRWSLPVSESMIRAKAKAGHLNLRTQIRPGRGARKNLTMRAFKPEIAFFEAREDVESVTSEVKTWTEHLEQAASSLKDWSEIADEWKGQGKTMASVKKVVQGFKKFSQLAAGLGLLGAGLGIVSSLLSIGMESAEDQIIGALGRLENQVSNFEERMNTQFKILNNKNEYNAARIQVNRYVVKLASIRRTWNEYRIAVSKKEKAKIENLEGRLRKIDPNEIHESVTGIYHNCIGTHTAIGLFQALYHVSNGDVSAITDVGIALYDYAAFGLQIDALVSQLQLEKTGKDAAAAMVRQAEVSNGLYQELLDGILYTFTYYKDRCVNEIRENAKKKMEETLLPKLDATDHKGAVEYLVNELRKQWFWMDWLSIVYDPVSGWDTHAMRGRDYLCWKRHSVKEGKINVVIKWDLKESPIGTFPDLYKDSQGWVQNRNFSDLLKSVVDKIGVPRGGFVWTCKRYQGVWYQANNRRRMKWTNGQALTIARYQ